MSDTPRTDAAHCSPGGVTLLFARTLERELAEAKAQLPAEMQDCTIVFKECEKGHGWLTATNWVQHGCPTCALQAAPSFERLLVAARKVDGLYPLHWDMTDGGAIIFPERVPQFEEAFGELGDVLEALRGQPLTGSADQIADRIAQDIGEWVQGIEGPFESSDEAIDHLRHRLSVETLTGDRSTELAEAAARVANKIIEGSHSLDNEGHRAIDALMRENVQPLVTGAEPKEA